MPLLSIQGEQILTLYPSNHEQTLMLHPGFYHPAPLGVEPGL